jgi:hypothetical protein
MSAMPISRFFSAAAVIGAVLGLGGCVTYLTPGDGAPMRTIADNASEAVERLPEAQFPASVAVIRVQAADYRSFGAEGVGQGNYSVVYLHEVEKPADFDAIADWPQVLGVVPLSRLTLPVTLRTFHDLLAAAAGVQADILFAYTFDTRFHIENDTFPPEQKITLGVLPGRQARVTSTASALFADVRSGFIYGLAEGEASEYSSMTKWTKPSDADATRLKAERAAFEAMMADAKHTWGKIAAHYGLPLLEETQQSQPSPLAVRQP